MTTVARTPITVPQARRLERARLRRQLKEGRLSLRAALDHPALQTMLVYDVLLALPSWRGPRSNLRRVPHARTLAQHVFAHIQRSPLVRVQDLTERECELLATGYNIFMWERKR